MRTWQLAASDPSMLRLAADARHFFTDYTDDQIWRLVMGQGSTPALALESRYGGRCGLARLVPMWVVDGRVIYEADAFAEPPLLRTFWPSYLRLTARPAAHLALQMEYWVMDSHIVGGRFTFLNESDALTEIGVDLFPQVMTEQQPGGVNILSLEDGGAALHLEGVKALQPVLLMQAVADAGGSSPKLAARMTLPPGEQTAIRWVLASLPRVDVSLTFAHHWMYKEDWAAHLRDLAAINAAHPVIETGDAARDAAIAFSYQAALQSFIGPTDNLPHPSFVMTRTPDRGFSPNRDGGDHPREWQGQTAQDAYLLLTAVAPAAPELAKGALRNFLAAGGADGTVDWRPGLGGQRAGALSTPLLAAIAYELHSYTEDRAFLEDVYPGLLRFFERWFAPDVDRDGDGLPEWQGAFSQRGLPNNPSFSPALRWAQNADIRFAESPDLAAYLIREARRLLLMADALGRREDAVQIQRRLDALLDHLGDMWRAETGSFHYRDRDTHTITGGGLLAEGDADKSLIPSVELDPPNRLIVRVLGGTDRPNFQVTLEGLDAAGEPVSETLDGAAFVWYRGLGAVTSAHVYARIDRITTEGLSRVFTVQVHAIDWTRQDVSLLLPLWAEDGSHAHKEALVETLADPARYWRQSGVAMCSAADPDYDPANQQGCGGVDLLWNTLLGEGLIEAGRGDLAAALFERLLAVQIAVLRAEGDFREAYNSDASGGLGERGHAAGIVPLHLLWRLMGFYILSERRVLIGGRYALPWPVKVTLHGVTVERNADGATITFPSGDVHQVVDGAEWQAVEAAVQLKAEDAAPPPPAFQPKKPPAPRRAKARSRSVRVKVQRQDPFVPGSDDDA